MDKFQFVSELGRMKAKYREGCHMITIYDSPKDHPEKFVARLSIVQKEKPIKTDVMYVGDTLAEVQETIPDAHFFWLDRLEDDEPHIVGVWI